MLHVHRSERADRLVGGLADLLRKPLGDPLAVEVVAVPARGVERWVTQRLSHVLGAVGVKTESVPISASHRRPHSSPRRSLPRTTAHRGTTTAGTAAGCSGRCSRSWTNAPLSRGRRHSAPGASPLPSTWRRCSTPTARTGRPCCGAGSTATTPTAPAYGSAMTSLGRHSCGGGCASGSVRQARLSGCRTPAPPSASSRIRSTFPVDCRSSAQPG